MKTGDRKTRDGQMCRTENARLENAASNYRTGNSEKRHVWKAKLCTSHIVLTLV